MSDLFISHVEEDAETARSIAARVEAAGFSTWYYERDTVPGVSYLRQVSEAIDESQAVVLLISSASLSSHQVTTEVIRAYEAAKPILPLLLDVSHREFQNRHPEWRAAVGAATSISLATRALADVVQALLAGLSRLGVQRAGGVTRLPTTASTTPPPSTQPLEAEPYEGFSNSFREVVAAQRVATAGALLHVVFGSIADIREMVVVIPVGQSFDFMQRGPRSVLASFEGIRVKGRPFFEEIDARWPPAQRPRAAGLGNTKYVPLPQNTHALPGVVFVVTTRNLSTARDDYGLYANTPIEGIDLILDGVIEAATTNQLPSLAVPLLGAGYANIRRTTDDAKLGRLLRQAVALLAIEKLQENLRAESSPLKRAVVVVYSQHPQSEEEHSLWESVTRFLGSRSGRSTQIEALLMEINDLCA
jgi:hypothetical protein